MRPSYLLPNEPELLTRSSQLTKYLVVRVSYGDSSVHETRTRVILPWPSVKTVRVSVARGSDELWQGVKDQSNSEIASFLRNLFQ